MSKAVVLGGGMVGSVIATDLAADMDVTVVDVSEANLAAAAERVRLRLAVAIFFDAVQGLQDGAHCAAPASLSRGTS